MVKIKSSEIKSSDNNSIMGKLLASLSGTSLALERGQLVEGKIVLITGKDIIVDLGAKAEGVISKRDLPGETGSLKPGDKIKASVVDTENESGQVILTIQRPGRDKNTDSGDLDLKKWEQITNKYKLEEVYKGKVTKLTQFGVFVELEPTVEGLIHSSKLESDSSFNVGQEVSVLVDSLDATKQRISLSPVITSTKGLIYK